MTYLAEHACVDCGETDVVVLEFDHLPGTGKRFDIATAVGASTRAWSTVLAEITKCEVVCANCHRRRTARRGDSRRYRLSAGLPIEAPFVDERPGRTVGHGEGAKGKRDCGCEPCRERRREYARRRRARLKSLQEDSNPRPGG